MEAAVPQRAVHQVLVQLRHPVRLHQSKESEEMTTRQQSADGVKIV